MMNGVYKKDFYTQENLLVAMSKLPEKEAKNILENMKISNILDFLNTSNNEQREQFLKNFLETLHRELDIYNGLDKLYGMLPVLECKMYADEGITQKNGNTSSESACSNQPDVVE